MAWAAKAATARKVMARVALPGFEAGRVLLCGKVDSRRGAGFLTHEFTQAKRAHNDR
jgi:hypothetical protein